MSKYSDYWDKKLPDNLKKSDKAGIHRNVFTDALPLFIIIVFK